MPPSSPTPTSSHRDAPVLITTIRALGLLYVLAFFPFSCADSSNRSSSNAITPPGSSSDAERDDATQKKSEDEIVSEIIKNSGMDADLVDLQIKPQGETTAEKMAHMRSLLEQQQKAIASAMDKRSRLNNALNEVTTKGCVLSLPIEELIIDVNAKRLETKDHGITNAPTDFPAFDTEKDFDTNTTIDFGHPPSNDNTPRPALKGTVSTEAFFTDLGKFNFHTTDFKDHTIGDIQHIKITKPTAILRSKYNKETIGTGYFNNKVKILDRWRFIENYRFTILSMTIKVKSKGKDYVIYNRQNIETELSHPIKVYFDSTLRFRDEYLNLFLQDCNT